MTPPVFAGPDLAADPSFILEQRDIGVKKKFRKIEKSWVPNEFDPARQNR
jgi:hypothetical protein